MGEHREDHADRHGFGGPDELDLSGYTVGGGDSLWESVGGDLHPITDPDSITVDVTTGGNVFYADQYDTILYSTDGSFPIDIDLNGPTGDINVWCNNDWNIQAYGGTTNNDFNASFDRDINLQAGRDVNESGSRDFNIAAGSGDLTATANNGLAMLQGETVAINGGDWITIGAPGSYLKLGTEDTATPTILQGQRVVLEAMDTAPADADLQGWFGTGNNICAINTWVDQTNHLLKFRVLYEDGTTFKTGEVSLDPGVTYGAWSTYTPSIGGTGWALGNGSATGRYARVGRTIALHILVAWGSTSTFGAGALTLSSPVAAASGAANTRGHASFSDTGTTTYEGFAEIASSTITPRVHNASATYVTGTAATTSAPHAWASTDAVTVDMVYEAAS